MALEEEIIAPQGYRFTSKFHYPKTLINTIEFFTPLSWGIPIILAEWGVFLPLQRGQVTIVCAIILFTSFLGRRMIQRGVSRLLGYSVSWASIFSIHITDFMADFSVVGLVGGEYRSYGDVLLITLAPLSLYIALLIPLLLGHWGTIGNMFAFILLAGLLPTIADIYFACWLVTKPRKAMLYIQRRTAWLFEPLSAEQRAQQATAAQRPEQAKRRRHKKAHHH